MIARQLFKHISVIKPDIYLNSVEALTCTVGNSLVGVDALVEITTIEEILQQLLNLGDTCGTTHQNDVMDLGLIHLGIPQGLLDRVQGSTKQVSIKLFKTGSGDGSVEIHSFVEGIDLNAGLSATGEGALGALARCAQATHSALVVANLFLELALELSNKVINHAVVKVFPTQVSVARCGLDFKDAIFNCKNGNVKGAASKVKNKHIAFTADLRRKTKKYMTENQKCMMENQSANLQHPHFFSATHLLVQAISNGRSSGLIDDSQHIEAGDGSSIFGGLTLGVIEVGRNSDNCIVHRLWRQYHSGLAHNNRVLTLTHHLQGI